MVVIWLSEFLMLLYFHFLSQFQFAISLTLLSLFIFCINSFNGRLIFFLYYHVKSIYKKKIYIINQQTNLPSDLSIYRLSEWSVRWSIYQYIYLLLNALFFPTLYNDVNLAEFFQCNTVLSLCDSHDVIQSGDRLLSSSCLIYS